MGLPALSPTMEVGTIVSWKFEEGQAFQAGDVICEVETDKATVDFEMTDDGVLAKILVGTGNEVAVGTPIMVVVEEEADAGAFGDFVAPATGPPAEPTAAAPAVPPSVPAAPAPAPAAPAAPAAPPLAASAPPGDRVFASPLARKLAKDAGYDISQITGTGPKGRIIATDVITFSPTTAAAVTAAAAPTAAPVVGDGFVDHPISESAREIAARLTQSKQQVPHYYLSVDLELDALLTLRSQLNAVLPDDEQLTLNDLLVKAAALAAKAVPDVNASWMETFVRSHQRFDVNVVMGVGDGLVAPVVKDVGAKGVKAISDEIRGLAVSAEEGSLAAQDVQVGTFTVLNLGMFGVKSAAPIVTQPQAATLALGAAEERVFPNDDPESEQVYRVATAMTATVSFDHRVVDGAVGAGWLASYKKLVENPMTMLL